MTWSLVNIADGNLDAEAFNSGDIYQFKYQVPVNGLVTIFTTIASSLSNIPIVCHLISLFEVVWFYGVFCPLQFVYFRGPSLWGWGFWDGRHPHDICAELVGYKIRFSERHGSQLCHDMLVRKLETFIALFWIYVYLFILLWSIRIVVSFIHRKCTGIGRSKYKSIYKTRLVNTMTPTSEMSKSASSPSKHYKFKQ